MEKETGVIDLSMCETIKIGSGMNRSSFSSRDVLKISVVKSAMENDIYKALNLHNEKSKICIKIQLKSGEVFVPREEKIESLIELIKSHPICVYVADQYDNDYYGIRGNINMLLPISDYKIDEIIFRDQEDYYDKSTATVKLASKTAGGSPIYISMPPSAFEDVFGIVFHPDITVSCEEKSFTYDKPMRLFADGDKKAGEVKSVDLTFQTISLIERNFRNEENIKGILLYALRQRLVNKNDLDPRGIKKVFDQTLPFYDELWKNEEVILLATYRTLVKESRRTINGVKVAKFFNQHLNVKNYEDFKNRLENIYFSFLQKRSDKSRRYYYSFEQAFPDFPGYKELRKEALRAQSGKALSKMMDDVEFLKFDEEKYPVLAELIREGVIPTTTFFRKEGDETYFIFNDNWDLFEEFLKEHREAGIELAKLASKRTTYEKSFMSYMYFILHDLPEYLAKHTGKSWKCFPKIVDSATELDPPRVEGETAKKRSALTPIVDNENCTVIVPYACLRLSGANTTYTYSLNYSLIRRGLSFEGNVCSHDLEKELNGRDDYGLMFYTLTGSPTGRGYPTFLIIFERLDGAETRVHFHRTHPLRSKHDDKNPINNWIKTCYNWMAGNVNFSRIAVQQGDLVFVSIDEMPEGEKTQVNSYDGHSFKEPVVFTPYAKKASDNILGYFEIEKDTELTHAEHRTRIMPAGIYELRQCRSWEANPKGIWSLRID